MEKEEAAPSSSFPPSSTPVEASSKEAEASLEASSKKADEEDEIFDKPNLKIDIQDHEDEGGEDEEEEEEEESKEPHSKDLRSSSPQQPKVRTSQRIRKRKEIELPLELVDQSKRDSLEANLESAARKLKMNRTQVRSVIRQVIGSPELLSIILEKAGEESSSSSPLKMEPRVTRTVAKSVAELGGKLDWVLEAMGQITPTKEDKSETVVLLSEELPDEDKPDEDPEYDPTKDLEAEDDEYIPLTPTLATTTSTSPPSKTTSTTTTTEASSSSSTSEAAAAAVKSLTFKDDEEDEEEAVRLTRSKASLKEVPIEELERQFIPPDITPDMYSTEMDDYALFLQETFGTPLLSNNNSNNVSNNNAISKSVRDSEDGDPDFVYREIDDGDDKNNLLDVMYEFKYDRSTKIPRREVDDLISELIAEFEEEEEEDDEEEAEDEDSKKKRKKNKTKKTAAISVVSVEKPVESGKKELETITVKDFSDDQLDMLGQQLRMHIQLLTQMALLTSSNEQPHLQILHRECKAMTSEIIFKSYARGFSIFAQDNLFPSMKLIEDWEKKGINPIVTNSKNKFEISRELMKFMGNSTVFIYPFLLPTSAPNSESDHRLFFSEYEDFLIIYGIEKFKSQCNRMLELAVLISERLMTPKTPAQIRTRIKNRRGPRAAGDNALKYYWRHGVPPPLEDPYIQYHSSTTKTPSQCTTGELPWLWCKALGVPFDPLRAGQSPMMPPREAITQVNSIATTTTTAATSTTTFVLANLVTTSSSSNNTLMRQRERILKKYKPQKKLPKLIVPKTESQVISKRRRRLAPKPPEETMVTPEIVATIIESPPPPPPPSTQVTLLDSALEQCGISSGIVIEEVIIGEPPPMNPADQQVLIQTENENPIQNQGVLIVQDEGKHRTPPAQDPNNQILIVQNKKQDQNEVIKNEKNRSQNQVVILDEEEEEEDVHQNEVLMQIEPDVHDQVITEKESSTQETQDHQPQSQVTTVQNEKPQDNNSNNPAKKERKSKPIREAEATLQILEAESEAERIARQEREAGDIFIAAQEKLHEEKLSRFYEVLTSSEDDVVTIFTKLHNLCGGHEDLQEMLLDLLTPDDALLLGAPVYLQFKLRDSLKSFLRKLTALYRGQPPSVTNRIFKELTAICNKNDLNLEDLKSTAFKLFKSNQYLYDEFLSILPDGSIPESIMGQSAAEFIDLGEEEGNNNNEDETAIGEADFDITAEKIELPKSPPGFELGSENCPCRCHPRTVEVKKNHCIHCSLRFLNGRVYTKEGKLMRPVRIVYPTEDKRKEDKRKRKL